MISHLCSLNKIKKIMNCLKVFVNFNCIKNANSKLCAKKYIQHTGVQLMHLDNLIFFLKNQFLNWSVDFYKMNCTKIWYVQNKKRKVIKFLKSESFFWNLKLNNTIFKKNISRYLLPYLWGSRETCERIVVKRWLT